MVVITMWSLKRYEISVFLVALSPWLSAIFISHIPSDDIQEAGMGSYLRIGLLILMGMVGTIQFFRLRSRSREKLPFHLILLGAFLLFALISTSYSIDPKYTFIRSFSFIALFGFLLGLHFWLQDEQKFERVLQILFLLVSFFVIINAMAMLILPGRVWWGEENNRFQGLWGHPNTMGSFCMISYPVMLWEYPRSTFVKKSMIILLMVALIYMHLLTGSRASIIATFLGIFVWFFVQKKKIKIILFLGIIAILALSIVQFRPSSFQREQGAGFTDLTGREKFWQGSYTLLMERPILGFGYGVEGKIWQDPRFYESKITLWSGSAKTSLHNGYLSIAVGLGIVSFFIWCIILLFPSWQSISLPWNDYKAFVYTVMIMCLVLNFFESVIGGTSDPVAILFWIAWVFAGKLPNSYITDTSSI